ncbi:hypothetical protein [Polaromonas sp. CG9_12]|nr:hypothetical protein [Polaromonas sp. CG9_12]
MANSYAAVMPEPTTAALMRRRMTGGKPSTMSLGGDSYFDKKGCYRHTSK